ncbi:probable glutathione S-transferase GSTF1 [Miscanthus floridulus]|uniref:probable glutathione S-transferase GSTF1 n=1 Tax=Miscanthus floridulus TaxID=154761 RepID=UPI003458FCE9
MAGSVVKVYGPAASPFVATVLVCLEEAGAAYELVPVDMAAREHKAPHHLARNPFGKIPAFQDGELTLFESRAISRHVLRKHYKSAGGGDLLREGDPEGAAMVDVWLEVEAHQYEPAIAEIVRHCVILPMIGAGGARDQRVVDESAGKLRAVLAAYEARLREHAYLAGGGDAGVSLADLAHFGFTHYLMATDYAALVEERPAVAAWWRRIAARPAARKVAALMSWPPPA